MIDVFTMENHDADTGMTLWGYRGEGCHFVSQGVKCKKSILLTSFFFFFNPSNILIWDIWYSELWENKFLFFNPPICGIDIPYLWYWYTIPIHFLCVLCTSLYDDLSYHSWNLYSSQDERFFKKFSSKKKWRLQQYNFHKSQKERKF